MDRVHFGSSSEIKSPDVALCSPYQAAACTPPSPQAMASSEEESLSLLIGSDAATVEDH